MKAIRKLIQEQQVEEEEAQPLLLADASSPISRDSGKWNARGFWTLTLKEIRRFLKIWEQSLVSPLVMTLLFYAVFSVTVGRGHPAIGGVSFLQFLIPGLVMMAMAQGAFINGAGSLILLKVRGSIVDVLMTPLSPFDLTMGYAASGIVRALLVGALALGAATLFAPLPVHNVWLVLYYAGMGSLMLALIGVITGIMGADFDHLGAVQNFIVTPATFLSGTFFSIKDLPETWRLVCQFNPFFYMIDGFRYGFTGYADGDVRGGMAMLFFVNLALFNVAYWLFARGTRLKT